MMKRWRFLAATAVLAMGAGCKPDAPQAADGQASGTQTSSTAQALPAPALWKTGDDDTTIYLFGTVHVLPPNLDWRSDRVESALGEAGAIYFETDIEPDAERLQTVVSQLGRFPPGQQLSDLLSPPQREALATAGQELGLPMFVLEGMRPWLAAMALSEQVIVKAGYDPQSGVERTLHPVARAAGKDIRTLETVEEQLLAFADLPDEAQVAYLMDGVEQMGEETRILADLVAAWARGDVDALDRIMIEGDLEDMPEVYQALLVRRNADWVGKLDTLAKAEAGVFFVAVGAGHLAGADSMQTMLAARGYDVARVE